MLLSLRNAVPDDKIRPLLDSYFPKLPEYPGDRASPEELDEWMDSYRQNRMCFIRAMSTEQARVLNVQRERAEKMWRAARA